MKFKNLIILDVQKNLDIQKEIVIISIYLLVQLILQILKRF